MTPQSKIPATDKNMIENDNECLKKIDLILQLEYLHSENYDDLTQIAHLNPVIIEGKLQKIFERILLVEKSSASSNISYTGLMNEILNACIKLRRVHKLVGWILSALHQSLKNEDKHHQLNDNEILPEEFINKFTECIRTSTNVISDVMSSFIYHFDVKDPVSTISSDTTIMINTASRLFIGFMEGVSILEYSTPLITQQKFVNSMDKFGTALIKFIKLIFNSNTTNNNIFTCVLSVISCWEFAIGLILHYAPDSLTEQVQRSLKINIDAIHEIVSSTNDQEIISFLMERNKIYVKETFDYDWLENIECCWTILLTKYSYVLSHLNHRQISILAKLLIANTQFDEKNLVQSTLIQTEAVLNNEQLITSMIFECLLNIRTHVINSLGITKQLINEIVKKSWQCRTIAAILKKCEKILADPQFITENADASFIDAILRNLKILMLLPVIHLNDELKALIFIVLFSIMKEWPDSQIIILASDLLLDVRENFKIDISQYINSRFISEDLSCNDALNPVLQNPGKIDKKLSKKIIESFQDGCTKPYQVKSLTVVVKAAIATKKIKKPLIKVVHLALTSIIEAKNDDLLVIEGMQLIKVVLQNRAHIPVDKSLIKNIWDLMLRNPSEDIIKYLLGATVPERLQKIMMSLQNRIVDSLKLNNDRNFEECLTIWNCVFRVDMGTRSNNIRQRHLKCLMQYFENQTSDTNKCGILKLFNSVILARKANVIDDNIDRILLIANNFISNLNDSSAALCEQELNLMIAFVKHRPEVTVDRLPMLLMIYRKNFQFIVDKSRSKDTLSNEQLQCLALNLNKLTSAFIKLKKDLTRVSPYIIADLVAIYCDGVVPSDLKELLDESVGMFLSICDRHAISFLNRALPTSKQELFKTLYVNYMKFYKFTGKI